VVVKKVVGDDYDDDDNDAVPQQKMEQCVQRQLCNLPHQACAATMSKPT
jgi:hypothetical protein